MEGFLFFYKVVKDDILTFAPESSAVLHRGKHHSPQYPHLYFADWRDHYHTLSHAPAMS